jgi:lipopolysaccharide/colanic/teichoic acid biosynthesis glycosyltransferase
MIKRIIDTIGSFIGLLLLLPVFLLVAIAIKLDSSGPVLYRQERVGRGGNPFRLFKFRTMHVNADRIQAITVGKRDPRITSAGFFLRRFKLDELPQLINVLIGEMSLVGPRPELKKFTDLYTPEQRCVLAVRPGITDPASIQFRNENEMLEGKPDPIAYYVNEILPLKLSLNMKYLQNRSALKDLRIIFITALSIFKRN